MLNAFFLPSKNLGKEFIGRQNNSCQQKECACISSIPLHTQMEFINFIKGHRSSPEGRTAIQKLSYTVRHEAKRFYFVSDLGTVVSTL